MTYTVRTPFLFWFGSAVVLTTVGCIISAWDAWMSVTFIASLRAMVHVGDR